MQESQAEKAIVSIYETLKHLCRPEATDTFVSEKIRLLHIFVGIEWDEQAAQDYINRIEGAIKIG
jgi:hypothetical protein